MAGERSFTLMETVIALAIIVTVVLETASVQGNAISLHSYARKATQAAWIAKGIMAELEYRSKFYPMKELKIDLTYKDRPVSEKLCPTDNPALNCDYTYTVTIDDFALPIIDILLGKSGETDDEGKQKENPLGELIKERVKAILGDEVLKIATVEVFWPEGAARSSVLVSYLMANQNALDDYIDHQPPFDHAAFLGVQKAGDNKPNTTGTGTGANTPGGSGAKGGGAGSKGGSKAGTTTGGSGGRP